MDLKVNIIDPTWQHTKQLKHSMDVYPAIVALLGAPISCQWLPYINKYSRFKKMALILQKLFENKRAGNNVEL